jgi:hypothetical protein
MFLDRTLRMSVQNARSSTESACNSIRTGFFAILFPVVGIEILTSVTVIRSILFFMLIPGMALEDDANIFLETPGYFNQTT